MSTSTVKKKSKKTKSRNTKSSSRSRHRRLTHVCSEIMGSEVVSVEFPGGKSRASCRMILDNGKSVIATERDNQGRANLEIRVLKALTKHNAPAPKFFGTDGRLILIQEELQGERLSLKLKAANESETESLLASSLRGLSAAQLAASEEGLDTWVPKLGGGKQWINGLIQRPLGIGQYLDTPPPRLNEIRLQDLLKVKKSRFVKWDSRPGNAQVSEDGTVTWFDWEHAGARNRLDDVAWILADEFTPDYPDIEKRLLDKFTPRFADYMDEDKALEYLMTFGTFHLLVRLGLMLKNKGDGDWWDLDYCIERDKIGITRDCALRTCDRGARWASKAPLLESLSPWFLEIKQKIADL